MIITDAKYIELRALISQAVDDLNALCAGILPPISEFIMEEDCSFEETLMKLATVGLGISILKNLATNKEGFKEHTYAISYLRKEFASLFTE